MQIELPRQFPLVFGRTGDWQFKLRNGDAATGRLLKLGIWIMRLRNNLCPGLLYVELHRPAPYSLLPEYQNQEPVCLFCNRIVRL